MNPNDFITATKNGIPRKFSKLAWSMLGFDKTTDGKTLTTKNGWLQNDADPVPNPALKEKTAQPSAMEKPKTNESTADQQLKSNLAPAQNLTYAVNKEFKKVSAVDITTVIKPEDVLFTGTDAECSEFISKNGPDVTPNPLIAYVLNSGVTKTQVKDYLDLKGVQYATSENLRSLAQKAINAAGNDRDMIRKELNLPA